LPVIICSTVPAVEIMLQNVRSEREGIWKMHLTSTASMLPYMFITNRVNYSRWLPVYLFKSRLLPCNTNNIATTF
jgi:hypothetical protein